MAASARFRLKQVPTDIWSPREKLSLASCVQRNGDNNWVSVSRAVKPFGEPNRPSDWFSQRNCAIQYSDLLEKVETPRRKRGEQEREVTENPSDVIVRKLAIERIEELKRLVQEHQQKYNKFKREVEEIQAGQSDEQAEEIWNQMQLNTQATEEAERRAAESMANRDQSRGMKRQLPGLKLKIGPISDVDDSTQDSAPESTSLDEESNQSLASAASTPQAMGAFGGGVVRAATPTSPLACSLPSKASPNDLGLPHESPSDATSVVTDFKQEDIILDSDIKTEPVEEEITVTVKEEVEDVEGGKPDNETASLEQAPSECATDSVSVKQEATEESLPDVSEKDKETDIMSVSTPDMSLTAKDEEPLSPTSSIMSNETDSGVSLTRGKGGRRGSRGSKRSTGGRRSKCVTRSKLADDAQKDWELSSKAESSDDDGTQPESDDTASNATGKLNMSIVESIPNSPASVTHGEISEDEKLHKIWKKSIMLVWRAAANHKYANVFLHPVKEELAPGYHNIVHRPQDLSTIKKNIENGVIKTTAEFQRDMMLMFTNAIMYNSSNHNVYQMATQMYDDAMVHVEQYVNTQMMVQSEPKLLRTSRRSEVQSDKEEDTKRKRTASEQEGGKSKKRKA